MLKILITSLAFAFRASAQDATFETEFHNLAGQLNSESFEARNTAQDKLRALAFQNPKESAKSLYLLSQQTPAPELRQRSAEILKELFYKKFTPPAPGYLGIQHGQAEALLKGKRVNAALVITVMPGTPAALCGLRQNDLIIKIDNTDLTTIPMQNMRESLSELIKSKLSGDTVKIEILRNGAILKLNATLAPFEDPLNNDNILENKYQEWLKTLGNKDSHPSKP